MSRASNPKGTMATGLTGGSGIHRDQVGTKRPGTALGPAGAAPAGMADGEMFALLKVHRSSLWRALWLGVVAGMLVLAP